MSDEPRYVSGVRGGYSVLGSGGDRQSAELYRLDPASAPPIRARIDLFHSVPFALGRVRVDPATRQVVHPDGKSETLEPRVMEVLVALHRAGGAILSRDDLIAACWRGMVVGDDAIQRVIQRLRKLASASGGFRIETITKVGYRLISQETIAKDVTAERVGTARGRRLAIVALTVCAVLALVALWIAGRTPEDLSSFGHHLVLQEAEEIGVGVEPDAAKALTESLRSRLVSFEVPLAARRDGLSLKPTIRREAAAFRVTATLENLATSKTVWAGSETFSADNSGIEEASQWLARAMGCGFSLLRDDPAAAVSPLMPIAMKDCAARTSDFGRKLQLAREMVVADSHSPVGFYAVAYAATALLSRPNADRVALRREALNALDRYRRVRPDSADGLALKALLATDRPGAERERMLRDAANARFVRCECPLQFLGDFLLQSGRVNEAETLYHRSLEQRPSDALALIRAATAAEAMGLPSRTDAYAARLTEIPGTADIALRLDFARGLWRGDRVRLERALVLFPEGGDAWHAALHRAVSALVEGSTAERRQAAEGLAAAPAAQRSDLLAVELYAALGDSDRALALLEDNRRRDGEYSAPGRMASTGQAYLWSPTLRALRRDTRFTTYLERAGFFSYWRETESTPFECQERDPPPYCVRLP